jgi:hypothetical protein
MATQDDAPTREEVEEHNEATPEEAEHEKRIDREKDHGGLGEDVKPDAEDAGPSSSNPPGS